MSDSAPPNLEKSLEKSLENLQETHKIDLLFVCRANQCRSIVAEAIVHTYNPHLIAQSAGILPYEGAAPHAICQRFLRLHNIEIDSTYYSKLLTTSQLERADKVLVMEPKHCHILKACFPKYAQTKKILALAEFTNLTTLDDPTQPNLVSQERIDRLSNLYTAVKALLQTY